MRQARIAVAAESGERIEARGQQQQRVGADAQGHGTGVDKGSLREVDDGTAGDRQQSRATHSVEDALIGKAAAGDLERAAAELIAARLPMLR